MIHADQQHPVSRIYDRFFDGVDPELTARALAAQPSADVFYNGFMDNNPEKLDWANWLRQEYPDVPVALGYICANPPAVRHLRLVA
jgi:radical SAM superfamily enzyme YgiQ (UPF0313 family)